MKTLVGITSNRVVEALSRFHLPRTLFGNDARPALERSIREWGARRAMLICDPAATSSDGMAQLLDEMQSAGSPHLVVNVPASVTPSYVDDIGTRCAEMECDLLVAIGGGATMDAAKLIGLRASNRSSMIELLKAPFLPNRLPLIAIPTTAGTGSEVTHFAVLYVDRVKHSVADASLRPTLAIVDPKLTHTAPRRVAAAAGLDALCQSIESLWSRKANDTSIAYAKAALQLAIHALYPAVMKRDPIAQQELSAAAHLAGHAIDVSFTTASHALSYKLTSDYQIPHGLAVAATLPAMVLFNARGNETDCRAEPDRNGTIDCLAALAGELRTEGIESAVRELVRLIRSVGGAASVTELRLPAEFSATELAESVDPQRLANNPRSMSTVDLHRIIATRFDESGKRLE